MGTETVDQCTSIIEFTQEQFEKGSEPYEYLYGLRNDLFRQSQETNRLEKAARAFGVKNFRTMFKNYVLTVNPDRKMVQPLNTTAFPEQDKVIGVAMNCGEYSCDEYGVKMYNPQYGETIICPHPILPTKRIINLDTADCKAELSYYRGGTWKQIIVLRSVLASAQKIVTLADKDIGVTSENAKFLVAYLNKMESDNYDRLPEQKSIGRLGWVGDDMFSPYVDKGELIFDGMDQYRHAFEAVTKHGSREKWMSVAKEVRKGNSLAARIMLAASFASVLIRKLDALPFIVHVWSNFSGAGKTVGLMLAGSVWANPQMGEYIKTFSTTNVGLEMLAAFYGDLPYCLDELCLRDGRKEAFDSMIYQFCEGSGKTRGSRNGGVQKSTRWNCCAISTGEEPLTSGSSRGGAVNRVIDVNAADQKLFDDPRGVVAILNRNYGWAGKEFIDTLTADAIAEIREKQTEYQRQMETIATDKQAISASVILAADWWMDKVLFKDGKSLTVQEMLPLLQSQDNANINKRAYEWLEDVVSANPMRFQSDDGRYSGECWGEANEDEVYIIKAIFDRIMKDQGFNGSGFLSWAKANDLLICEDKHMTKKKRIDGLPAPARCVCLKLGVDVSENSKKSKPKTDAETGYEVVDEDIPF